MGLPLFLCIQGIHADAPGDIFAGAGRNFIQRPLDTVKNIGQDARAQGYGDGRSRGLRQLSRLQSGGLLIHLHGGGVLVQADDFSHQALLAHIHHLMHLKTRISFYINYRAVDSVNDACLTHGMYLPQM